MGVIFHKNGHSLMGMGKSITSSHLRGRGLKETNKQTNVVFIPNFSHVHY